MEVQLYTEWDDNHAVSIKHGLRTADHGLRTGYKISGLGIKRGLENMDWV